MEFLSFDFEDYVSILELNYPNKKIPQPILEKLENIFKGL